MGRHLRWVKKMAAGGGGLPRFMFYHSFLDLYSNLPSLRKVILVLRWGSEKIGVAACALRVHQNQLHVRKAFDF